MGKGIGIAALVVAIVAIIVPLTIEIPLLFIGLLLAAVGAWMGEAIFSVAVVIITFINVLILSPVTRGLMFTGGTSMNVADVLTGVDHGPSPLLFLFVIFFAAAIFAIIRKWPKKAAA